MNFSVLISIYCLEQASHLAEALDSILNQTLAPSEIVLVKDGPLTEELDQIIHSFIETSPGLFKVVLLPKNMGLGYALKIGLESCTNELVIRMDTDDICYSERFEIQINFMNRNLDISVLGTSIQEFDSIPGDLNRFRKLPSTFKELVRFAKYRNPLNHPSVVFRKSHIIKAGSYQEMALFEDFYLWVRVIKKGYVIANLHEPLLHFRVGNDMVGRRHGLSYCIKEYAFLRAAKEIGFLNISEFVISCLTKLPLRLLPKRLLKSLYKILLR